MFAIQSLASQRLDKIFSIKYKRKLQTCKLSLNDNKKLRPGKLTDCAPFLNYRDMRFLYSLFRFVFHVSCPFLPVHVHSDLVSSVESPRKWTDHSYYIVDKSNSSSYRCSYLKL